MFLSMTVTAFWYPQQNERKKNLKRIIWLLRRLTFEIDWTGKMEPSKKLVDSFMLNLMTNHWHYIGRPLHPLVFIPPHKTFYSKSIYVIFVCARSVLRTWINDVHTSPKTKQNQNQPTPKNERLRWRGIGFIYHLYSYIYSDMQRRERTWVISLDIRGTGGDLTEWLALFIWYKKVFGCRILTDCR